MVFYSTLTHRSLQLQSSAVHKAPGPAMEGKSRLRHTLTHTLTYISRDKLKKLWQTTKDCSQRVSPGIISYNSLKHKKTDQLPI